MASQIIPFPTSSIRSGPAPSAFPRQISIDGEYFDDDLPPELFDDGEELDELAVYVHMAEAAHDE